MKKLTAIILVSILTISVFSCKKSLVGEGPLVSQVRPIPAFTGIDLQMYGDVYYKNDSVRKVEIIAQQNVLDKIETFVTGSKLVIKFSASRDFQDADGIKINISGPNVNGFLLSSAGSIHCLNDIQSSILYLRNSGSGDISLEHVAVTSIDAETNGSGAIKATTGTTLSEKLKTTGSGQINLSGITSNTVTAHTVGSGSIRVRVNNHLDATIDGTGSIYYNGYPSVSTDISGPGRVIHF